MSLTPESAHALVRDHLEGPVAAEPYVQTVEYDPELHRWYVRFTCDTRDATTIYFDLHQRTLRYEVYFLPAPPEPSAEASARLYAFLLQRNHTMYGARFSLGPEGDIYLLGRGRDRAPERGRDRPNHRRALRAHRAPLPDRGAARLRAPGHRAGVARATAPEGPPEIVDAALQELEYPGDQTDEG